MEIYSAISEQFCRQKKGGGDKKDRKNTTITITAFVGNGRH